MLSLKWKRTSYTCSNLFSLVKCFQEVMLYNSAMAHCRSFGSRICPTCRKRAVVDETSYRSRRPYQVPDCVHSRWCHRCYKQQWPATIWCFFVDDVSRLAWTWSCGRNLCRASKCWSCVITVSVVVTETQNRMGYSVLLFYVFYFFCFCVSIFCQITEYGLQYSVCYIPTCFELRVSYQWQFMS